jgi:histidine ammonia-lyase
VELLAAVQGIEFHRPLKSSAVLERAVALVRSRVKPYLSDRFMAPDLEAARSLVASGQFRGWPAGVGLDG